MTKDYTKLKKRLLYPDKGDFNHMLRLTEEAKAAIEALEAERDEPIVSVVEFKGRMYVATARNIYRFVEEDDTFERLSFVVVDDENG